MVIVGAQFRLRLLDRKAIRENIMRGLDIERFLDLCVRSKGQVEKDGEGKQDCEQRVCFELVRTDVPQGLG